MKRIQIYQLVICLLTFSYLGHSQVDSVYMGSSTPDPGPRPKRQLLSDDVKESITWGGNFQIRIGNPTFIFLSPTVGFIPYKNLNIGIGGIYNYTSVRTWNGDYSESIFGGHSFARYIFAENYFVQMQFDKLYQPDWYSIFPGDKRWVNYLMVGVGFRQMIGDKVGLISSVMYNLTPDPLSIYPNRFLIQFGIAGTL